MKGLFLRLKCGPVALNSKLLELERVCTLETQTLRGCNTVAEVFTSYSRKDKAFVRKLSDALANQKREAWIDWKDIPLTAEWLQEILTNIEAAENFIFVISPDSVASPNCRKEMITR